MISEQVRRMHWSWNPTQVLSPEQLRRWIAIYHEIEQAGSIRFLEHLRKYEVHNHVTAYLDSTDPLPLIMIARAIHCAGYRMYFPDSKKFYDAARRPILSADTDATQGPGITGQAWLCYTKNGVVNDESKLYGLMYELEPARLHIPGCPISRKYGWRTLPIGKLFLPQDAPSPLSNEGIRELDRLERSGAQITEVSGLSVRADTPDAGLVFHEIMRRIVHRGIIMHADSGFERVLTFAIVETTRNRIRTRMGRDNFVSIGESFTPPGQDVDKRTILAPSIIQPSEFLNRLVTSYRSAIRKGRPVKVLVEGIRFYTRGLAWRYLSLSPDIIELLAELDAIMPNDIERNAENGWHDQCGEVTNCATCNVPRFVMTRVADVLFAKRADPRTLAA